ncbi:C6 zinc finger domain protein [Colletotrichum plurivorum]|uniref:C6 zinc finger domain protein n=1 Tax=Colletotrichum plurivorum TaxID=2175906 RepID=A0A8H6KNZ6_9PEZI|nr:C6 zinc finger domain protein [Colletotrichum plurivorum]
MSPDQQMTGPGDAPQASLHPSTASSGRKGSKKVRTGCVTIRKVKCDETKPACIRCTKTGRKCDGYLPQKQPGGGDARSPGSDVGLANSQISLFADWNGGEQRAFDFYRNFSAPAIFNDGAAGSVLWKKLVPHLCHAEPAIRHAVLAISSLHESLSQEKALEAESGDVLMNGRFGGVLPNTFAAEQYGKALKCLQEWKPSEPAAVTVPLLACLLFICIEFLLGDENASQMHINQGRLLLSQLDTNWPSGDVDIIRKHFVPIYSRLCMASYLFGSRPAEIPSSLRSSRATSLFFASVDEAEMALYELLDDSFRFTGTGRAKRAVYSRLAVDPELIALAREQDEFLAKLNRWHVAFTVVAATDDAKRAGKLCLLYYHTAKIWVGTCLSPNETEFDNHLSSFASIVSISADLVHSARKPVRDPSQAAATSPKFVFDAEIIPPLYYTAIKCRHPMLRRAAINLLKQDTVTGRRENLWDAQIVAEVARRIMIFEEEAAAARREIPDLEAVGWDTTSRAGSDEFFGPFVEPGVGCDIPVPYAQYPLIPKDVNHRINEEYEMTMNIVQSRQSSVSTGVSSGSSATGSSTTSWGSYQLESPFNLPEVARVKNALIDNGSLHGSWVTIFMDPDDNEREETRWKITRIFVKSR